MLVEIGKATPIDSRVDKLVADGSVTREDIQQIVQWLISVEERTDAIKIPEIPEAPPPVDFGALNWCADLDRRTAQLTAAVEKVGRAVDLLHDDFTVSEANNLKLYKDFNDLQNAIKRLQQQPPKVEAHHNHVYTPESNKLLWIAIAVCFLVGALAHVV